APPEHEQADQPSRPERARDEMQPVDQERCAARRRLASMTCQTRNEQACCGREKRTTQGEQLGDRALFPLGPVEPERDCPSDDEERERQLEIEKAASEGRIANQR